MDKTKKPLVLELVAKFPDGSFIAALVPEPKLRPYFPGQMDMFEPDKARIRWER